VTASFRIPFELAYRGVAAMVVSLALIAAVLLVPPRSQAQTPGDTQTPTAAPAPLLAELSRETERVVADTRDHLVVVRLPAPRWVSELAERDDPILRWGQRLDPRVRQALDRERQQIASGGEPSLRAYIEEAAPSAPATAYGPAGGQPAPDGSASTTPTSPSSPSGDNSAADTPSAEPPPANNPQIDRLYGARAVGIWLDPQHVLIPVGVDPRAIGQAAILVLGPSGRSCRAGIVGFDRRTDLTLLALDAPATEPAAGASETGPSQTSAFGPPTPLRLAARQPERGSLVLLVASADQSAQLTVWAGGHDERGLVVDLNGAVAGLARPGMYLDAGDLRLTVSEMARYGHVRRAALGVLVEMAPEPDGNAGIEIEKIDPQGPAAQAGVREGDFLLSIADRPVPDMASLGEAIVARDGPTSIQVLRAQQELTLSVMLAAR
jgi:hypothetical protein